MLDIAKLLEAMENQWNDQEEEFEWTKLFSKLEETCPKHRVGEKNLELMRYTCPICGRVLNKQPLV